MEPLPAGHGADAAAQWTGLHLPPREPQVPDVAGPQRRGHGGVPKDLQHEHRQAWRRVSGQFNCCWLSIEIKVAVELMNGFRAAITLLLDLSSN